MLRQQAPGTGARLEVIVSRYPTWAWASAIFLLGLAVRLYLLLAVAPLAGKLPVGEVNQIAHSLFYNGRYADAYGPGTGPTAHDMPLFPLVLSGMIHLFGEGRPGEIAIRALTAAGASGAYALLPVLSEVAFGSAMAGIIGGALGASIPLSLWLFVAGTNQGLSACFMVLLAILLFKASQPNASFGWTATTGLVAGVACLMNAPFLGVLGGCALSAVVTARRNKWRVFRLYLTIALLVAVALTPWAIRNQRELGKTLWTRSNFGTELALANQDGATPLLDTLINSSVWRHPLYNPVERDKVKKMGEPAYNAALLQTGVGWIEANPGKFLRLTSQRIFYFWFPRRGSVFRTGLGMVENLLGLLGFALLLRRGHRTAWLFCGMLGGYSFVFSVLAADPRYSYPTDPLLLLLAGFWLTNRNKLAD